MKKPKTGIIATVGLIQKLTEKSERQCRRILKQIREFKHKKKNQPVTIYDVSEYYDIPLEVVLKAMEDL